jgi:hypothetical protein
MRINAVRWWLIRPAHNAVLGVITAERRKVLSVPGIIKLLHILQVLASVHKLHLNFLTARRTLGSSCSCPFTCENIKTSARSLCATPGEYALLLEVSSDKEHKQEICLRGC